MSKTYADLVANFNSSLTNQVLIRRDAYLRHAHPSLDAFRLRNLCSAPVSGGDLFDRSLMQEYEQHLIGLGVNTGTKKEHFHPYKKKRSRGGNQRHRAPQSMFYQPMPAPQYMLQQPFYPHPQGGCRGGRGGCRGRGHGGNTSKTKQQQPPQWHSIKCVSLISPWSERNNSFRNSLGLFLPPHPSRGGKDSECPIPSGQGKDSLCTVPSGEGKDSLCTVPSGEGKDSLCTVPPGKGKDSYKIKHTSGGLTQVFSCPVGMLRGPPVYTQSTQGRLQTAFQRTPKPVQAPANKVLC